jgi:hypothetical protein
VVDCTLAVPSCEANMLYYPDGASSFARYIRVGLSFEPDISRRDDASPNRFSLHRQICSLILKSALDGRGADRKIDCSADILLTAKFPGNECPVWEAVKATARIDICFDPTDFGADPGRPLELSPEQALREIIENEVDRAWGPYRLDAFVDDVRELARCLHSLTHWDGRSVVEVIRAMQQLEPLVVRHGHDVDDFVNFYKPAISPIQPKEYRNGRRYWDIRLGKDTTVPLPEGVWPADLPSEDVLLFDAAGRTLVVDEWGRLAVGPTLAERIKGNSQRAVAAQSAMDHVA